MGKRKKAIAKLNVTGELEFVDTFLESAEALLNDVFEKGDMSGEIATRLVAVEAVIAKARQHQREAATLLSRLK